MSGPLEIVSSFLVESAIRGALLLAAAHAAIGLCPGASAARRDAMWTAVFAAFLLLPLAGAVVPAWTLPVDLSVSVDWPGRVSSPVAAEPPALPSLDVGSPSLAPGEQATSHSGAGAVRGVGVGGLLVGGWLAVVVFLLGGLALRHARAAVLASRATPLRDDAWAADLRATRARLGLSRRVQIRQSPRVTVPLVARSCVLVPADAGDWDALRRRVVLLHELSHIQRGDFRTTLLVDIACITHWFNPLVWSARRRSALVREQACDDAVLETGVADGDYARELLAFARRLTVRPAGVVAGLSLTRCCTLERRLRAVLDRNRNRQATHGGGRLAILATVVAASLPIAAATIAVFDDAAPEAGWLETLRDSPDPELRSQAAWALGEHRVAESADALVAALADSSAGVREQAAWAVGEIGLTEAEPALIALFGDVDPAVREQAAWALGEMRLAGAVPGLVAALSDGAPGVRARAAWALGEIVDTAARDPLLDVAANDSDAEVRREARRAIEELDDVDRSTPDRL